MSLPEPDLVSSETLYDGKIISLRRDQVRLGDGKVAAREIISHPGAVAIAALDDEGRLLLVNQYRHAVGARLDELPAGLLDHADEDPLVAAQRELAEETRTGARTWNVLLDLYSSPGFSDESVRIFLARDLHPLDPDDGFTAEGEEASMTVSHEPVPDALRRVFAGHILNSSAVAGVLAVAHGRATGWRDLRPADAPWPSRRGPA
ncbi:MAG: NUDIX domain-containing protein [Jatrophihabitans sp.]|uniref:NUDIX domain-containing protein n=1 Tax=Jatrophihabitans sp. TaxID=1932789 RepID=UPI003F7E5972